MDVELDFGYLWLSWNEALLVVASTLVIYSAIIAFTRTAGQRSIATLSTFDLAVTVALGSIIGRVALVHVSLGGGVLALLTLFLAESVVRLFRNRSGSGAVVDSPPVMLLLDGEIVEESLRSAGLSTQDVHAQIRQQGHASMSDIAVVVFERNGSISVVPKGKSIQLDMFRHVKDIDRYADRLLATESS